MVNITTCLPEKRNILLDQAAPILEGLKSILKSFEEPEAGYFGEKSIYIRLSRRGLVLEQPAIEKLLEVAKKNDAVLSIDTREGPLVATIMKHDGTF
jgi:hypothetical protein